MKLSLLPVKKKQQKLLLKQQKLLLKQKQKLLLKAQKLLLKATEAPTESTEAPTESTEAPTESTEAPTESTEAPTESTEAPSESTEAPTESTEAPTESTEAPTESTEAPTESTEAPTESTEAPTESTEAPTESTEAPTESTEAPTESTEAPTESTEAPSETGDNTDDTLDTDVEPTADSTEATSETLPPEIGDYQATWEIGNRAVHAGTPVSIPITVTAEDMDALLLNSYKFELAFDFKDTGIVYSDFTAGTAYPSITPQLNLDDTKGGNIAGTLTDAAEEQAANNSTVIWLNFNVPEGVAPDVYPITFVGDVEAAKASMQLVDVIEENGYIEVLPDDVVPTVVEYQYNIEGKSKFYFSHDNRPFDLENDLLRLGTMRRREIYSDNTAENPHISDWTIANEFENVEFKLADETLSNPKAVYDNKFASRTEYS